MADRVLPGPVDSSTYIREAVCIHTSKIFDSCRDKDCVEDLRVYPTLSSQAYISSAFSVRPRSAELLCVDVDVDEITFNRGYYTVDAKFFHKVKGEVFPGGHEVTGLAVFDKRVILFGSEGNAKVFTSAGSCIGQQPQNGKDQPIAVVEAVDPLALGMKVVDSNCCSVCDSDLNEVPDGIVSAFCEDLVLGSVARRLYVTLGQFSIIRLERDTQLVMPVYDYCLPDKECEGSSSDEDPCTLFSRVRFPVEEFFPPDSASVGYQEEYKNYC